MITPEELKNGDLAAEIYDSVNSQLPSEKARAARELAQTAKEIKDGTNLPTKGDGRGQPIASIPPIIYMRWEQEYPGCWRDKQFVQEFLADNPQCQLPGYKAPAKPIRFSLRTPKMNPGGDLYHERKAKVRSSLETINNGQH